MEDAPRTELSAERQLYQAENINFLFQVQRSKFSLEKTTKAVKCPNVVCRQVMTLLAECLVLNKQ